SGRPGNAQVPTEIPGRIRDGYYAYGVKRHKNMAPNATSGHALMPPELRAMFDRAFSQSPNSQRPSAADWAQLLRGYAQRSGGKLVVCAVNAEHQHFAGQGCAACARDKVIASAAQASASAQASAQARQAAPQRSRALPGKPAPAPAPQGQSAVSDTGWVVIIILIVIFVIGFAIWTAVPDEAKKKTGQQATTVPVAGLEQLDWHARKAGALQQSDVRRAVRNLSQAMGKGDDAAVVRGLQLLYRSEREKSSGYSGDLARARLRTSMMESMGWLPGYQSSLSDTYLDLLQADPRDHLAAAALARTHLSLNEPQAARQYFEQAVWARPTDGVAWLGIAATALLRGGGGEQDAANLVALAQVTAQRHAAQNAMPAEEGEAADNGVERTAGRMERAANMLRLVQPGAYPKRWDKALADGALLAKKLAALPAPPDQGASVQRDSMATVAYRVLSEAQANGESRLTLSIAADGSLSAARAEQVMEPMLNKVILDSLKRWTFNPSVKNGQFQDGKVDVLVRYRNGRVSFEPAGVAATAEN
ncbi:MAG: hypothetical protein RR376_18695, partial [Janthinobacterium sp.]